ncbi:MAG: 1-acyl-sn-glycerol-3-phosphate acyltransferase [Tetrasphaera sp.]|nr:1-acyl-sn-glycerol-3-phosphate acyltransferase [Tetrasphaera sp.]
MATEKTPAKKTAAKKSAAPKASARKSAARKSTVKKPTAKKSATSTKSGTSRKAATTKKAATKKASTPAGKTAARKPAAKTASGTGRDPFATGVRRAAAERHTPSPLLQATVADSRPARTAAEATAKTRVPVTPAETRLNVETPAHGETPAHVEPPANDAASAPERRLRVVPDPVEGADEVRPTPTGAPARTAPRLLDLITTLGMGRRPQDSIETAVTLLAQLLRMGAEAAGLPADEVEEQVARTLAYLRRHASGEFAVDEFGFDQDFTDNVYLPLLRPIYQKWFRVEVRGAENLPKTGGALIVANHSGTLPMDGLMTQVAVHDEGGRHLRMLGADLVFELPFVGMTARRAGTTLAAAADAERLLREGHLVGVYPEGFKGIGKPFSERYKLQRFGRGGFVSAALRTEAPIIPCAIVGAEEIYPLIGDISILARLLGAPYFPVTPFFPLLGLLGLIPLPSKWIIAFGEPLDTSAIGPAGAEDPMLVFDLTDQVRETIQQTLYALLMQRRSVFF